VHIVGLIYDCASNRAAGKSARGFGQACVIEASPVWSHTPSMSFSSRWPALRLVRAGGLRVLRMMNQSAGGEDGPHHRST
jgi:hypothetical protein